MPTLGLSEQEIARRDRLPRLGRTASTPTAGRRGRSSCRASSLRGLPGVEAQPTAGGRVAARARRSSTAPAPARAATPSPTTACSSDRRSRVSRSARGAARARIRPTRAQATSAAGLSARVDRRARAPISCPASRFATPDGVSLMPATYQHDALDRADRRPRRLPGDAAVAEDTMIYRSQRVAYGYFAGRRAALRAPDRVRLPEPRQVPGARSAARHR